MSKQTTKDLEAIAQIYVARARNVAGAGWALLGLPLREGLVMREIAMAMLGTAVASNQLGDGWQDVIRRAFRQAGA